MVREYPNESVGTTLARLPPSTIELRGTGRFPAGASLPSAVCQDPSTRCFRLTVQVG